MAPGRQILGWNLTTWAIGFSNRTNGMISEFKMLSNQQASSRTIVELDGDTATLLRA